MLSWIRALFNRPIWLGSLQIVSWLYGIVFPVLLIPLAIAVRGSIKINPWQSGELSEYSMLILCGVPFLFGILPAFPAIAALFLLLMDPVKYRKLSWVRASIGLGSLLALQMSVYELTAFGYRALIVGLASPLVGFAYALLIASSCKYGGHVPIAILTFTVVLLGVCHPVTRFFPAFVFFSVPMGCAMVYFVWLLLILNFEEKSDKEFESSLVCGVTAGMSWLACTFASFQMMLYEYSQLPKEQPNCYISSAAASGSRWLVRSTRVSIAGEMLFVNNQMRYLKVLELFVKFAFPRVHFILRMQYDRIGPPLARTCKQSLWFSNATFLALLPLEWLSRVLCRIVGITALDVGGLYGGSVRTEGTQQRFPSPRLRQYFASTKR